MIMEYPFEHREYQLYPVTFLQSVMVGWNFDAPGIDPNKVMSILSKEFNLTFPENFAFKWPISITSNDKTTVIRFNSDGISLRNAVDNYKGFDSLGSVFTSISNYMHFLDIPCVSKLSIAKRNIWSFDFKDNIPINASVVVQRIFSNILLKGTEVSYLDKNGENNPPINILWKKSFEGADSVEKVDIRYGFSSDITEALGGEASLDLSIVRSENIALDVTDSKMKEMNHTLFDAYHWSVNEKIIEIMKGNSHE